MEEKCIAAAAQAAVAGAALDHTPLVRQPYLVAAARPAPLAAPAAAAVQSRSHHMELRCHQHQWYQSELHDSCCALCGRFEFIGEILALSVLACRWKSLCLQF
jgi:hypothetical protein